MPWSHAASMFASWARIEYAASGRGVDTRTTSPTVASSCPLRLIPNRCSKRGARPAPARSGSRRLDALREMVPDEQVVGVAADHAADDRRDDRHPPPAVPGTEDFAAPP